MQTTKKKVTIFSPIDSREDALKLVKDSALGYMIIAGIQGVVAIFLSPEMIIDAALFLIFALILLKWKSRISAVILTLLSLGAVAMTIINKISATKNGGTNIILAVFLVVIGIRTFEATFKLHGRFSASRTMDPNPDQESEVNNAQ